MENEVLDTNKLLTITQKMWDDEGGMLGMAEWGRIPVQKKIINGRLFELQIIMTSKIEDISLSEELIP